MLSFRSIPEIAGSMSFLFCVLALAMEELAAILYLIGLFSRDAEAKAKQSSDLFSSGIHLRNSMYCSMLLLFFIANTNDMPAARNAMNKIASVAQIFCAGAAVLFFLSIAASVLIVLRRIKKPGVLAVKKKIWRSSLFSFLLCLLISYFMSV